MNKAAALKEAVSKGQSVAQYYSVSISQPLNYSCEQFLLNIIQAEGLVLDSFPFNSKEVCGMLIIDELEKTIVYNSRQPRSRRNFTIAHELGHYFLHSEFRTHFADRSRDLLDETESILEMQANAFASQIILPKEILFLMIYHKYSFFRISKIANVSYEALYWIIVNHLTEELNISRNDAILIVDDYHDYSIGSSKNLIHHNFAAIFRINRKNSSMVISNLKNGIKPFEFERNISGEIIGVRQLVSDPFSI